MVREGEWGDAGVEAAVSWLLAHEGDPYLQRQLVGGPAAPSATLAGVAGLLRREQEAAATAERCEARPRCRQVMEEGRSSSARLESTAGVLLQLWDPPGLVVPMKPHKRAGEMQDYGGCFPGFARANGQSWRDGTAGSTLPRYPRG